MIHGPFEEENSIERRPTIKNIPFVEEHESALLGNTEFTNSGQEAFGRAGQGGDLRSKYSKAEGTQK